MVLFCRKGSKKPKLSGWKFRIPFLYGRGASRTGTFEFFLHTVLFFALLDPLDTLQGGGYPLYPYFQILTFILTFN